MKGKIYQDIFKFDTGLIGHCYLLLALLTYICYGCDGHHKINDKSIKHK
jgi:hypothetical protein